MSLKNLQFEASGVYICEVTTDNPIYTKPSEEEYLVVMRKYLQFVVIFKLPRNYLLFELGIALRQKIIAILYTFVLSINSKVGTYLHRK